MTAYGPILAERRQRFGLSLQEVSVLSGLAAEELVAIESGAGRLTMLELELLGRALVFDPAALLRGEGLPDARRLPGCFRSHMPDTPEAIPAHDARLIALAAELGEIGAFLQGLVGESAVTLDPLRSPIALDEHDQAWRQGYELGARARAGVERLDPTTPASHPLRSVQSTLERFGVHVAFVSLEATLRQAVSVSRPQSMPVVLLNAAHDRARRPLSRRAVLAHQLGHLLHDTGEIDLSPHDRPPPPRIEAVEQRANGFAPAFLAPPRFASEGIVRPSTTRQLVLQLAREWGFTLEGAVWHAKNIELLSGEEADALVADVGWRSGSTLVPGAWEPDVPRLDPRDYGLEVDASPLASGRAGSRARDRPVRLLAIVARRRPHRRRDVPRSGHAYEPRDGPARTAFAAGLRRALPCRALVLDGAEDRLRRGR